MSQKVRFCEICRQRIDAGRLEFLPQTLLCAEHGRQIEKHGGEFHRAVRQERTSKAGGIKQSYGSADIQKTRNTEALEKLRAEYLEKQTGKK